MCVCVYPGSFQRFVNKSPILKVANIWGYSPTVFPSNSQYVMENTFFLKYGARDDSDGKHVRGFGVLPLLSRALGRVSSAVVGGDFLRSGAPFTHQKAIHIYIYSLSGNPQGLTLRRGGTVSHAG